MDPSTTKMSKQGMPLSEYMRAEMSNSESIHTLEHDHYEAKGANNFEKALNQAINEAMVSETTTRTIQQNQISLRHK